MYLGLASIGSCVAEIALSALSGIKAATISEKRLARLTMVAMHYTETTERNAEAVVKCFIWVILNASSANLC